MSNIDTTDVILAGLGIGGFLWMNRKLEIERRARAAAEQQRDCARACAARIERPANGLTPTSASAPAARGLAPRSFDSIFATYGQGIPVPYLRALALRESNMNPRSSSGPAWGLLQVIEVVRQDHNERTGARYTRQDLLDPVINVTIAASALATIVRSYAQNHPRIANLQANWNNPRFIELLTFGWNAGWSERGGVGRVATYLEQRGVLDQSLDKIHQASRAAGASPHLANAAKVAWSKSVAAQYFRELAAEERPHGPVIEMPEDYVGRPTLVMTGPITSPSQVSGAELVAAPTQVIAVAQTPAPAPLSATPAVAVTAPPMVSVTPAMPTSPSGVVGPINPYADCPCPT